MGYSVRCGPTPVTFSGALGNHSTHLRIDFSDLRLRRTFAFLHQAESEQQESNPVTRWRRYMALLSLARAVPLQSRHRHQGMVQGWVYHRPDSYVARSRSGRVDGCRRPPYQGHESAGSSNSFSSIRTTARGRHSPSAACRRSRNQCTSYAVRAGRNRS